MAGTNMDVGGFYSASSKSSPRCTGANAFIEYPQQRSSISAMKQLRLESLCLLNDYRNCSP